MATDSDTKLTKYKAAVTIVTADFANSIFGGLYGSAEADSLNPDDPRVRGHIHDGTKGDGHAPKVHLVDHVESQLTNPNLGDDSVTKRNIWDTTNQDQAIPEYRISGSKTYYYLDLRSVRSDFVFQEDLDPAGDGSQNKVIRQRNTTFDGSSYVDMPDIYKSVDGFDFVFGSSSLEDLSEPGGDGDSRFQFDKSKGAFRAGFVTDDQWDDINRGTNSIAFGYNNIASGVTSTVSGGGTNEASAVFTTVSGGSQNRSLSPFSSVGGGNSNEASGGHSTIAGGLNNESSGDFSSVGGGDNNKSLDSFATVSGGMQNTAFSDRSYVGGGHKNEALGTFSTVSGGDTNISGGDYSVVSGGNSNKAEGEASTVSGGKSNEVTAVSLSSTISGGESGLIDGSMSVIAGGIGNSVSGTSSVISGGENSAVFGSASVVSGGSGNAIKSDLAVISGGFGNEISPASRLGVIVGGESNYLSGEGSSIVSGFGSTVIGVKSFSIGGKNSRIDGSDKSFIIGVGSGTLPLNIGVNFSSIHTSSLVPGTPTEDSGIVGGQNIDITGGTPQHGNKPSHNFVAFSKACAIGGGEAGIYNSNIIGSNKSEILGVNSSSATKEIRSSSIVNSEHSSILMGPDIASASIYNSDIFGGYMNGINHSNHTPEQLSPWFDTLKHAGQSEYGVQTSLILGGTKNCITNSSSAAFADNSLYSTIIGGHSNVISSSIGSTIIGGGAYADFRAGASEVPEYDKMDEHYSNIIVKGHHSTILNGTSNAISRHLFPFNADGLPWRTGNKTPTFLPAPVCATAQGRESYSYLYGQASQASAGHTKEKFISQGFDIASIESPHSPTADWSVLMGSFNYNGEVKDQPGSAQSSALTFVGSWDYDESEVNGGWTPASGTYFEFNAYLDGGRDSIYQPNRGFIPRYPASYTFDSNVTISYTEPNSGPYGSNHNILTLRYRGYIVYQLDGSATYGGSISDVFSTSGATVSLFDPGGLRTDDFSIGFCPDWNIASNSATTPATAFTSTNPAGTIASGGWPEPNSVPGLLSWPPNFSFYVVNNTGDPTIIGGNGSKKQYVGESLVAKVDFLENLLFLARVSVGGP